MTSQNRGKKQSQAPLCTSSETKQKNHVSVCFERPAKDHSEEQTTFPKHGLSLAAWHFGGKHPVLTIANLSRIPVCIYHPVSKLRFDETR